MGSYYTVHYNIVERVVVTHFDAKQGLVEVDKLLCDALDAGPKESFLVDDLESLLGLKLSCPPKVGASLVTKRLVGDPFVAVVTQVEDHHLSIDFPDPEKSRLPRAVWIC